MKKILLFAMAAIIGISTGNQFNHLKGNVAYASNEFDTNFTAANGNSEKNKAEFAYDMTQITSRLLSAPVTNMENFKIEFAYATAQVTAKVMPNISDGQRTEFAYKMAQLTAGVVNNQNVDMQKAKAEFAYEIAQITTKMLAYTDGSATIQKIALKADNDTTTLLRNNADIEQHAAARTNNNNNGKLAVNKGNIDQRTYKSLINEFMHTDSQKSNLNKVNINGEIRYHYAFNRGTQEWDKDSSGFRTYLGFDSVINDDWHAFGMFEGNKNIANYKDQFKLTRLYATGKSGVTMVTAGSFGYLMAEGNIYDSSYAGVRFDYGRPVKYSLSLGKTDSTKKTYAATVHYDDFDYNLEASIYYNQMEDTSQSKNTIWTLGGNYNFSNFSVGAMCLGSNQKDSKGENKGYVFSINYGDLKTYRNDTYSISAKYYNQPKGTYISHGMNGIGNSMQGFKGYGFGMHYTFAKNLVAGIEYYGLTDKISGDRGNTWWNEVNYYF